MDLEVPYMPSVGNLHKILDKIQKAGAPDAFGLDFLIDLGFTSSNDRAAIKLFKYIGFLDAGGKPQNPYREFMDETKAKYVLADRLRIAYDDLFLSDKNAESQSAQSLKGWFKTKTGKGDAVAEKMALTFKSLANYAVWDGKQKTEAAKTAEAELKSEEKAEIRGGRAGETERTKLEVGGFSFAYRIEIHLPDTTNVDTYRSIFRAIREELGG